MKINLLHILLVLVALQSTIAVADLHQSHQSGQDHLKFDHVEHDDQVHDTTVTIQTDDSISDTVGEYDCHHCCHCHGVACHYLDNQQKNQFTYIDVSIHFTNNFYFNSRSTSPALRPPIIKT